MTREQIKKSLKSYMEQVEKSSSDPSSLLINTEYRTAASLLSIMEKQDEGSKAVRKPA